MDCTNSLYTVITPLFTQPIERRRERFLCWSLYLFILSYLYLYVDLYLYSLREQLSIATRRLETSNKNLAAIGGKCWWECTNKLDFLYGIFKFKIHPRFPLE